MKMADKKYQVFISSTYEDLKEERKAVEETIIRAGDFPVGMEAFPAADEEQFDFIKTVIDSCDYYILVIAGRYGSVDKDGVSYTEKEYKYAVEKRIPVLVLLHTNRGQLPADKSEQSPDGRIRLDSFIDSVSTSRLRKPWQTTDGLKLAVREALDHAKLTKPRPGWVRGSSIESSLVLEELVRLQKENRELRVSSKSINVANEEVQIAGLDTSITLNITYESVRFASMNGEPLQKLKVATSFGEVFSLIAPHLLGAVGDRQVKLKMAQAVAGSNPRLSEKATDFSIADQEFQLVKVQLLSLGLVEIGSITGLKSTADVTWSLTEAGRREMIARRAVKVESQNATEA